MTSLRFCACVLLALLPYFLLSDPLAGQTSYPQQEVHVHDLPQVVARSKDPSDVLAASVEVVVHDRSVCCGKDSALQDSVQAADPKSLKDIANRLQGRHLLSDGRPIMVTTEYIAPDQLTAGHLVYMLMQNHAALMIWNSHLYVVDGAIYLLAVDNSGLQSVYAIQKFLLSDARFADSRREVVFNRETEDPAKVQGILFLDSKPQ